MQEFEDSLEASQEILYRSEQILYSVEHIVLNTRGYILTGDPAFVKPITSSRIGIIKNIQSLRNLTKNSVQHSRIDTLTLLVEQRIQFSRRFIETRKQNRLSEKERSITVSRGEDLMKEVRNCISRIQTNEERSLKNLKATHRKSKESFNFSLILLLAVIVVLFIIVFFSIKGQTLLKAKSEYEIRKNNIFLQTILNTIAEGVAVVDKGGEIVLFNRAAEKILGIGAADARQHKWWTSINLYNPNTLSQLEPTNTPLSEALQGKETEQMELFIRNESLSGGAFITISARPIRTDGSDLTGAVAVFYDSTDRKKQQDEILQLNIQLENRVKERTSELSEAVESLKRNKDLLNETGKMAKVGGWEIIPDTMTMKWTDELFDIHQIELGKLPDISEAINYYAPEARPIIEKVFQNCLESGVEWEIDLPLITAKGERIWVRSNGKAEIKNNRPIRLFGALQDITESKKDEQERTKMIDALLIKNTDIEEFTYIVSHNLRAPLANIKGLASLIEKGDIDDETKMFLINAISISAKAG